jgi:hypothetical protein
VYFAARLIVNVSVALPLLVVLSNFCGRRRHGEKLKSRSLYC